MTLFALLFTLAAIGISETAYLVETRRAHEKPVCLTGESCMIVLRSKYSTLFGIHNDLLGLFFYIAVCIVAGIVFIGYAPQQTWLLALQILLGAGSLMSLFLTYLQARVIKAWCFWCLLSACTIWLMTLLLVVHHFAPNFLSPSFI